MTGLMLAMTIGLTTSAMSLPEDDAQKNGWYTDYGQALAEARQLGRLLFVVFR